MITFIFAVIALLLGYLFYSKYIERVFGADKNKQTPAFKKEDGVDFMPLKWGKIFLIQFLNIAGLGPIFGAVAGALWGPVAFIWIVLGSIFAGAVHDYLSGMISIRFGGDSIPEVVGRILGLTVKQVMRGFTVILLVIVGAVFIMGPAKIIDSMTPMNWGVQMWSLIILVYYIVATLLPIDKIIGKVYPLFGAALLIMAVGIVAAIFVGDYTIPEVSLKNMHADPKDFRVFPMLFITIACGAISGFHSTQSPLMARCLKNETEGRKVFYGAMISEGLVALIWAAAAMAFFNGPEALNSIMAEHNNNAAWAVNEISVGLLGKVGALLVLLGVVAAPISTGDTAFRSARLIVADFTKVTQGPVGNRLLISIPLFLVGYILTWIDFGIVWRYFAWSNQTLSVIVLWAAATYLFRKSKNFWVAYVPAVFMSAVTFAYILVAPEGFSVKWEYGAIASIVWAAFLAIAFFFWSKKKME